MSCAAVGDAMVVAVAAAVAAAMVLAGAVRVGVGLGGGCSVGCVVGVWVLVAVGLETPAVADATARVTAEGAGLALLSTSMVVAVVARAEASVTTFEVVPSTRAPGAGSLLGVAQPVRNAASISVHASNHLARSLFILAVPPPLAQACS